jgi:hypothetical protein
LIFFYLEVKGVNGGVMKMKTSLAVILAFFVLIQPLSAQLWSKTERLTWNWGASWKPSIAVDSNNNLHIVWKDGSASSWEIYYKKSTNGGMNWTTKRLTWNPAVSSDPKIATDSSNNIHVVWYDYAPGNYEIFYKKSTDGGANWITKRLTWNPAHSYNPSLAVDSNNHIHVAWYEKDGIFYKKSTDGGASWSTERLTWNPTAQWNPSITTDSNNHIHVTYCDNTPGNTEIFYKKSTDGGVSWRTKRLTWNSGESYSPVIASDSSDNLHVVWADNSHGDMEIFLKRSKDGGTSWTMKRLTCSLEDSTFPAIASDSSDNIHVVWTHEFLSDHEIYYARSTDEGATWTTKKLSWRPGSSDYPGVATDSSDNIYVVWEDDSPGNDEIYLRIGKQ